MTELQLELTRLIGKKKLSFGLQVILKEWIGVKTVKGVDGFKQFKVCGNDKDFTISDCEEIIGHPATLSDFHRCMNNNRLQWKMTETVDNFMTDSNGNLIESNFIITQAPTKFFIELNYDSSKDLLSQSEKTLKAIISLITSHS